MADGGADGDCMGSGRARSGARGAPGAPERRASGADRVGAGTGGAAGTGSYGCLLARTIRLSRAARFPSRPAARRCRLPPCVSSAAPGSTPCGVLRCDRCTDTCFPPGASPGGRRAAPAPADLVSVACSLSRVASGVPRGSAGTAWRSPARDAAAPVPHPQRDAAGARAPPPLTPRARPARGARGPRPPRAAPAAGRTRPPCAPGARPPRR